MFSGFGVQVRLGGFAAAIAGIAMTAAAQAGNGKLERFAGAPFHASAEELRAAAAAVPVDPAFEAQILLEEGVYRFAADGTHFYQHRLIYRVDSAEGVKNWAEISEAWDPWNEKPAQLQARVLQINGRFAELDQKTVTDAPVKADDAETYSSSHMRRGPLPGLAVGAIVEEVETTEERTPYFGAGGLYSFRFRAGVPHALVRVSVDLPVALPFLDRIDHLPALAVQRTESDGRRHIVYEQVGMPAAFDADIDLSTNDPERPMIEFATGASWKAVASGYAALADPQTVPDDTAAILPATAGLDRRATIAAVVARLHREVRYTGVEFGESQLKPQRPAEVIKRHYGDCKDKATLLVAMLRAEKIPAHLALLDTGPGRDVDPALPGMNHFDHAIVYVPAAGSEPAVWIDATAEFFAVGSLPWADQGRLALVIAPETEALLRTPEPAPSDSALVETRTFTLAPFGPARVVEASETRGVVDAAYRSDYGGEDAAKVRAGMEKYAQSAYLAKGVNSVTHGPAAELSKPFALTLTMDSARRGSTDLNEAVVVIFPSMVLDSLPQWLKTSAPAVEADTPAEVRHRMERAGAARVATYVYRPFTDERRVRIAVPDGFALRALPPAKTTALGPATLTESYSSAEKGFITAVFHFDSGPGKLTADGALAMRKAVLELNQREYVGVYFDQVGSKLLADGKIREGLTELRRQSTQHPSEALPHLRLSRALLRAGIGDAALVEARRATEADPKSARAWNNLGWTLQHDSLGVRFGKGYDRAGAITAYKRAVALDAEDDETRFDLAILEEFDARGTRYTRDANMPEAIAGYRELIERNKDRNSSELAQYRENLLYCLLLTAKYGDLEKLLATLPASQSHAAMTVAATTAKSGAAAGVAAADRANLGGAERSKALLTAGNLLVQMRLYPEASAVLQAGISGGSDAPTTARQIEMYKTLKPASTAGLPATDPAAPLARITLGVMSGQLTADEAAAALAHHAYASPAALHRSVEKNLQSAGFMRAVAEKSGVTEQVLLDLVGGGMKFTVAGDDATGHTVVMSTTGSAPSHFFVVREDGVYRAAADSNDRVEVGQEALYLLGSGNPAGAKALLDWKRDLTHREGTDDPLAGAFLPRFWTVGSSKAGADSPEAMRLAAISLLAGSMDAKPYLAEVAAAREKATGQRQTDLDLLLAQLAVGTEQPKLAMPALHRLLEQEPDSETALELAGQAYVLDHDTQGWLAMLQPRLAKKPKDHDLLVDQARAQEAAHDFPAARAALQGALDSGKATASDYNAFAWLGLFDGHLGEPELKAAQQSNMLSNNASFADLHTLACVYAAEGRTTEARQVLAQAMYAANRAEPNSAIWFALGLIYEQYGETDAALAAFRKVQAHEDDDHTFVQPTSTYLLAQARVLALSGKASASAAR